MISDKEMIVWWAPSLWLEATEAKGCEACGIAKRNLSVCQEATGECSALETTSLSPLPRPKECHKRDRKNARAGGWGGECHEMCVPGRDTAMCSWTHPSYVFLHKIAPPLHHSITEGYTRPQASLRRVPVTVNSSLERKHHFLCGRATGHFPMLQRWYPTDPRPCGPP